MSSSVPRIRSLDGLRGAAALAVVLYHVSLVARPEMSESAWAWLTQSPVKLLFPGTEAVLVFFVLSGLVVALPAVRPGFSWLSYYPARLVRLYLPVAAALVLATACIYVIPRDRAEMPEGSWMSDAQATAVSPLSFLGEASLTQASYDINNVLWSLRWEVIFSLLLPLFVWSALRVTRHPLVLCGLCVTASVLGRVLDVSTLVYIPAFLIGTIMATRIEQIRAWKSTRTWLVPSLTVLAAVLLLASWFTRPVPLPSFARDALWGLAGAGAALCVFLAVASARLRRGLESRPFQWLGRISFSLYLVHAPLIATLVYLLGSSNWLLAGLLAVPLSLSVAAAFQRLVETPSHRLAKKIGQRLSRTGPRSRRQPMRSREPVSGAHDA